MTLPDELVDLLDKEIVDLLLGEEFTDLHQVGSGQGFQQIGKEVVFHTGMYAGF